MGKTEKEFEHLWGVEGTSRPGEMFFLISEKRVFPLLEKIRLKKNSKIIDVGCGTGRTLKLFRKNGYYNSIGIDISKDSLSICKKRGLKLNKDVFLNDIKSNKYKPKSFDLVFSEGLLEHFKNMQPTVNAMCRVSKKYVLVLQPNHTSVSIKRYIYRLFEILFVAMFKREHIYEIPYTIEDYENSFRKANFKLARTFNLVADSGWGLLFERIK